MRHLFVRSVHLLRLPFLWAVVVIVAMTSLPAESYAWMPCPRIWEYNYYYDAARTQWAGYCTGACYPGGAWCMGVQTEYYVRSGGELCDCFVAQQLAPPGSREGEQAVSSPFSNVASCSSMEVSP